MADASSERTATAPQEQQDDSNSSTGSPTKAQQLMAAGAIPESMDHWKPGEIDEEYITELQSAGWISDFVITKENKGSIGFRWRYFIMDDSLKHDIKGKGLLPFHQGWNKSVPVMDECLKRMTVKVTELVSLGLRGMDPRNPRWLPAEVSDIPKDVVENESGIFLRLSCSPSQRTFQFHTVLPIQQKKDMFGPDLSEGGAECAMVLDSSSGKKEPRESLKKSSAEAFANDVLNSPDGQNSRVDLQSLEEKVANVKATLMSQAAMKSPSPPKSRPPPKTRSSKPGSSGETTRTRVQPGRERKFKSPMATPVSSLVEVPSVRAAPSPGDQVPLSIVFGTLFAGFSRISQTHASQGQQNTGIKRPRVRAAGHVDVTAAASAIASPSGSSSEPSVFAKIVRNVQAAEAWTLKTCQAYSSKVHKLQQENSQLQLKLSETVPNPVLANKDAKISELEVALVGANKAFADLKTAHASEVKTLQDTNNTLTVSVAVEEGYARCIAGSAYTIALFQHHLPNLDLGLLSAGFKYDAIQRDAIVDQVHTEADAFVTSLELISSATPAEEEVTAEDEGHGDDQE
ncbi:hypothetical protein EJB05_02356, partial [Eragrostis curvula]